MIMPRTRPRLPVVLTALLAAAPALTLAACSAGTSAAGRAEDPRLAGMSFSGHAEDDARVVFTALEDHVDVGVCARRNPERADRSWIAPLVAVPASLLDGNAGCGMQVTVSNDSGTTVTATVVGQCGSCNGDDIALSPELFHQLAGFAKLDGTIAVTWRYTS
jgi:hypothetical protein